MMAFFFFANSSATTLEVARTFQNKGLVSWLACRGSSSHGCSGAGHSGRKWRLECHEYADRADLSNGQWFHWFDGFYEFDDAIRSSQFPSVVGFPSGFTSFVYRAIPRGSRRCWEWQLQLGAKWRQEDTRAADKLRREVRRDCWESGPFRGAIFTDFSFKQRCFFTYFRLRHVFKSSSYLHHSIYESPLSDAEGGGAPSSVISVISRDFLGECHNVNECQKKKWKNMLLSLLSHFFLNRIEDWRYAPSARGAMERRSRTLLAPCWHRWHRRNRVERTSRIAELSELLASGRKQLTYFQDVVEMTQAWSPVERCKKGMNMVWTTWTCCVLRSWPKKSRWGDLSASNYKIISFQFMYSHLYGTFTSGNVGGNVCSWERAMWPLPRVSLSTSLAKTELECWIWGKMLFSDSEIFRAILNPVT